MASEHPHLVSSPRLGELPGDGPATIGTVIIDAGHRVYADAEHHGELPAQGWTIDHVAEGASRLDTWQQLVLAYPQTGLWPIVAAQDEYLSPAWQRQRRWYDDRDDAEPPDDLRGSFGLDSRSQWRIQEDAFCFECGVVKDRSGELAIAATEPDLPNLILQDWRYHASIDITLVSAARPADSVAQLGWTGGCNAGWIGGDAVPVLRSWEERFGAYVFHAGRSTMGLVVARPPRTVKEARMVAREHFHFCGYDTQFHGFQGIGPYVQRLIGNPTWSFWWD